jgi:hypothetical protein
MKAFKIGDAQEFTLVTISGLFYQAAIQYAGGTDYIPSLSQTAKPSRENAPSFYQTLPMNARGGVAAQFVEIMEHAERLGQIIEVFAHIGPKLISKEEIAATYPNVAVVFEGE